jgi:hypothetical protein
MFRFELLQNSNFESRNSTLNKLSVPPLDSYEIEILLYHLCNEIDEKGDLEFVVGGFGLENWNVDIFSDLRGIAEQLPEFIENLNHSKYGVLDFYEQGQQKILRVNREVSHIKLECESYLPGWTPQPSTIVLELARWDFIINTFIMTFFSYVKINLPLFYSSDTFQKYFENIIPAEL